MSSVHQEGVPETGLKKKKEFPGIKSAGDPTNLGVEKDVLGPILSTLDSSVHPIF